MKFYNISFALKKDAVYLTFDFEYDEKGLFLGKENLDDNCQVKISQGKKFYDIIRFQDPFNFAISKKLYNLLATNDLSGWKTYKFNILNHNEVYYGFQITGRCGNLKRPKTPGPVNGLEFDYKTWDGSDFFCSEDSFSIFCTEKVRDLLLKNKISNIEIQDFNNVEWYST